MRRGIFATENDPHMGNQTDNVDAERNTVLGSLTQVGPTKPVG
jgi:hypothetical protein